MGDFDDLAALPFTFLEQKLGPLRGLALLGLLEVAGLGVHELELEPSGGLDEGDGLLGVLDAGQLERDLVLLLLVDGRLGHAVLVDPAAGPLQGLGDRRILQPVHLGGLQA